MCTRSVADEARGLIEPLYIMSSSIEKLAAFPRRLRSLRCQARRDGLGRTIAYVFKRLDLEHRHASRLSTSIKIGLGPLDYLRRKRMAGLARAAGPFDIPHDRDYLVLPHRAVEGTAELVESCQSLLERNREAILADYSPPYSFVLRVHQGDDGPHIEAPEDWEAVISFACQPQLVGIVAKYIREIPVISGVSLTFTPEGEDARVGPQQFHRDMNHPRQAHLIVAIEDIDSDSGPFTFFPGDRTRLAANRLGYKGGRVADSELLRYVDENDAVACTGPAGSTFLVNPYACFHYGARTRKRSRYMLLINYTSRVEGVEGLEALYRATNRAAFDDGSWLRRKLLHL